MKEYKVLVTGPFNSGKTTFIRTLCGQTLNTEVRSSDVRKETTTSALDFGIVMLEDDGVKVRLFGTPGQERFFFMVKVLGYGMHSYIFLVDINDRDSVEAARRMYRQVRWLFPDVPHVVAANKYDLSNAMQLEELKAILGLQNDCPLVPLVAYNHDYCINTLRLAIVIAEK